MSEDCAERSRLLETYSDAVTIYSRLKKNGANVEEIAAARKIADSVHRDLASHIREHGCG